MIESLHIENFILINKLDIELGNKFCVITGETGAGKSILLDSILFCLGQNVGNDIIKPGADSCSVTIVFSNNDSIKNILNEYGINEFDNIIIKRIQNKNGKKKSFINDNIVSPKLQAEIFKHLIEFHGQNNHIKLSYIDILDEFGNHKDLLLKISEIYKNWQETSKKLEQFENNRHQIQQQIEYLEHICSELDAAEIQIGEESKLSDQKQILQVKNKEIQLLDSILKNIESLEFGPIIAKSQKALSRSEAPSNLEDISDNLDSAYDSIENVSREITELIHRYNNDDSSLEFVEDRLYEIRSLAKKHNCNPDDLQLFLDNSRKELNNLNYQTASSSDLIDEERKLEIDYFKYAKELSCKRREAALQIETKVHKELSLISMPKAEFNVEIISEENNPRSVGIDQINFIASTNPGMRKGRIDKIASGGELSRFMLAFKNALFENAPKQTVIFDEIDVGISGAVADSVGERINALGQTVQVIAITHQPQVASKAQMHISVEKVQHNNHTEIFVKTLDPHERKHELAKMISGQQVTETGLKAAYELLSEN